MTSGRLAAGLGLVVLAACGAPTMNTPVADVPKLATLEEVMDTQATVADPQLKKAGQASYADGDWAAFVDLATRIQATSLKIKDFSKGAEFDALALQLHAKARALGDAAATKDAAAASGALRDMKAACDGCHTRFR